MKLQSAYRTSFIKVHKFPLTVRCSTIGTFINFYNRCGQEAVGWPEKAVARAKPGSTAAGPNIDETLRARALSVRAGAGQLEG